MLRTAPTNDANGPILPTSNPSSTTYISKNSSFLGRTFRLRNILIALLVLSVVYSIYFFASKRIKFSVLEKCETEKSKIIQDFSSQVQHLETQILNIQKNPSDPISTPISTTSDSTSIKHPILNEVIPIVIFSYKRANELKRALQSITKYMPRRGFQLFVSQDGDDASVAEAARSFEGVTLFQKDHEAVQFPNPIIGNKAYYYISQSYKFGLTKVFDFNNEFKRVIILEEDIEIAPDFFDYFVKMASVLDADSTLFCVSAWNDNGMRSHVLDPLAVYRSDFFPGLGWMMTRSLWEEVKTKWPLGYWDDWLRLPENRKGRACLRPEVSRTFTFGQVGVSGGQFFNEYLSKIELNKVPIHWQLVDATYLKKENYDPMFASWLQNAKEIQIIEKESYAKERIDLKIKYNSIGEFRNIATAMGVMTEEKSGVPRGAYKGVVTFRNGLSRLFIYPSSESLTYKNE